MSSTRRAFAIEALDCFCNVLVLFFSKVSRRLRRSLTSWVNALIDSNPASATAAWSDCQPARRSAISRCWCKMQLTANRKWVSVLSVTCASTCP
eukprot:scaffold63969_cov26-Tisochrysis_lutea.AAC.2